MSVTAACKTPSHTQFSFLLTRGAEQAYRMHLHTHWQEKTYSIAAKKHIQEIVTLNEANLTSYIAYTILNCEDIVLQLKHFKKIIMLSANCLLST